MAASAVSVHCQEFDDIPGTRWKENCPCVSCLGKLSILNGEGHKSLRGIDFSLFLPVMLPLSVLSDLT